MLTQILSFFRTKALSLMALAACTWLVPSTVRGEEFTILQWNIWQEGTMVKGGYDAIVEEIVRLKPDFVTLSEVRNYHNTNFTRRLTQSLLQRGLTYYSFKSKDTGLLSRYPITDSLTVFPEHNDHGSIYRLLCDAKGKKMAVYTAHLDYLDDAYYNVRGYDGSSFREIPIPRTVEEVLERNVKSQRDDAIRCFIEQAKKDEAAGYTVVIGGDFNEPSHEDWTEATRYLYDHHGLVVPWTVTSLLAEAGFRDAYRTFYPNVLTHPGFTFPSDNPDVSPQKLTWAPLADERDRIDYLWYKGKNARVTDCRIFGPEGCIVYSRRCQNPTRENFIKPLGVWPTDHKGVWMKLEVE